MAGFITRSGALGPFVSATTHTVPVASRLVAPSVVVPKEKPIVFVPGRNSSIDGSGAAMVTSGIGSEYLDFIVELKFKTYS